jgi:hypothetical protein
MFYLNKVEFLIIFVKKKVKHDVDLIVPHEQYDKELHNDIALLRLKQKITFNDNAQPICLSESNFAQLNKTAIVTGWVRILNRLIV